MALASNEAQPKIAAILSAYDDLIANNQRRIALLEGMAEEIYREWFVRMRFPGAATTPIHNRVPDGWETKRLPEVASITYGFPFAGERFNAASVGKPIIRIRDVLSGSSRDFTDEIGPDKCIVRAGDLLIGMDGEFHMNHWVGEEAWLVQRVCKVEAKNTKLRGYIAQALGAPINHYQQTIVGATVGHLGAKHLNEIDVLMPPPSVDIALLTLNNLLDQKVALAGHSLRLSRMRDALLPRLISGKLKVDHLAIRLPPSMQGSATA
ncbi:MAG: restriction endonuclease subunit S [Rubrivivax sp.]